MNRTFDIERINALANDPSIRPYIGFPEAGPIDASELIDDHNNVALIWEHGAFVFSREGPEVYDLHTMVLPEGRGSQVVPQMHEAFKWLFSQTPATEIVTQTAHDNKPAGLMARRAGFVEVRQDEEYTYFTLPLETWVANRQESEQCH